MRRTKNHERLLEVLGNSKRPVSVPELLKKIQANKTTLYRQLEKMVKEELVVKVDLGDGTSRYESINMKHHHHVVCDSCGQIQDVTLVETKLMDEIQTEFKILRHSMEFFGLCKPCQLIHA